jgi:hypothetical protein
LVTKRYYYDTTGSSAYFDTAAGRLCLVPFGASARTPIEQSSADLTAKDFSKLPVKTSLIALGVAVLHQAIIFRTADVAGDLSFVDTSFPLYRRS